MQLYRLLLTSNGLTSPALMDEFHRLVPDPARATVWYIPTAPLRDGWSEADARMHAAGLQADLGLGRLEWIDPEYTRGESLRTAVSGLGRVDVVWVAGGNTYNLAHHVHASGGGEIIKDLLADGTVFVGASAGSILAGRTVQTVFWKNWDDQTCEGTVNVDWKDAHVSRGLDVAGGISIFPHANGPYGGADWQNEQAQRHGHNDHTVVRLADGQGVVVEDGTYRLV